MIQSTALYTTKDLQSLGIGRDELIAARRSGLVKPRQISGKYWYSGTELIRWSETRRVGELRDVNEIEVPNDMLADLSGMEASDGTEGHDGNGVPKIG